MKKLTKAAAKSRLTVFEVGFLTPLVREIDARHELRDFSGLILCLEARDALYTVHDYLRRVASELEAER